jgi:hypothetical protein
MENEKKKLMDATASFVSLNPTDISRNPWRYTWESNLDKKAAQKEFTDMVRRCRFYYTRDPLTSTTINKLIDIGINTLKFHKNELSDNQFKVFEAIKTKLVGFAADMALEYLISGLVVPEMEYGSISKEEVKALGIKTYNSLVVPQTLWLRDPMTIEIKASVLPDQPSYYVEIPPELLYFVGQQGIYPDGSEDQDLYAAFKTYYPDFVARIIDGELPKKMLLDNKFVIRRRVGTESVYPMQYLSSAVDILEHKRNLRRTDYSIANKVMSAILQISVGDKDFPMTDSEEDRKYMDHLKEQLLWRNRNNNDIENIFQLFTSHVVQLKWIFPDFQTLLNDAKYTEINQEILFALGFPRILISGETERSSAGDQEFASLAPIKTMEVFREKILVVIKEIAYQISKRNGFDSIPEVEFEPINFHKFDVYVTALSKLFDIGGLSRDSFADVLGYNFNDEVEKRASEQKKVEVFNVPAFGENPNSRAPSNQQTPNQPAKPKQPAQPNGATPQSKAPVTTKKVTNNGK